MAKWMRCLAVMVWVGLGSCRSYDHSSLVDHSELQAIYDHRHYFSVAYSEEKGSWRFEVCRVSGGEPDSEGCVNAFRLEGREMTFDLAYLEENAISEDMLRYLKARQRMVVDRKDLKGNLAYQAVGGFAVIGVGVHRLAVSTVTQIPLVNWGSAGAIMLIAIGNMVLGVHAHERKELDYMDRILKDTPQYFNYRPRRWLAVMDQWPSIVSSDPEVSEKVSSVEDQLHIIALFLTGLPSFAPGKTVTHYCMPADPKKSSEKETCYRTDEER